MVERKTYIINIDGMRADYFGATGNHQECLTPTLLSLKQKGTVFDNCKTIMPANTGTNHTAIMPVPTVEAETQHKPDLEIDTIQIKILGGGSMHGHQLPDGDEYVVEAWVHNSDLGDADDYFYTYFFLDFWENFIGFYNYTNGLVAGH